MYTIDDGIIEDIFMKIDFSSPFEGHLQSRSGKHLAQVRVFADIRSI